MTGGSPSLALLLSLQKYAVRLYRAEKSVDLVLESVRFKRHSLDHFLINQFYLVCDKLNFVDCDNCTIASSNLINVKELSLRSSSLVFSDPD